MTAAKLLLWWVKFLCGWAIFVTNIGLYHLQNSRFEHLRSKSIRTWIFQAIVLVSALFLLQSTVTILHTAYSKSASREELQRSGAGIELTNWTGNFYTCTGKIEERLFGFSRDCTLIPFSKDRVEADVVLPSGSIDTEWGGVFKEADAVVLEYVFKPKEIEFLKKQLESYKNPELADVNPPPDQLSPALSLVLAPGYDRYTRLIVGQRVSEVRIEKGTRVFSVPLTTLLSLSEPKLSLEFFFVNFQVFGPQNQPPFLGTGEAGEKFFSLNLHGGFSSVLQSVIAIAIASIILAYALANRDSASYGYLAAYAFVRSVRIFAELPALVGALAEGSVLYDVFQKIHIGLDILVVSLGLTYLSAISRLSVRPTRLFGYFFAIATLSMAGFWLNNRSAPEALVGTDLWADATLMSLGFVIVCMGAWRSYRRRECRHEVEGDFDTSTFNASYAHRILIVGCACGLHFAGTLDSLQLYLTGFPRDHLDLRLNVHMAMFLFATIVSISHRNEERKQEIERSSFRDKVLLQIASYCSETKGNEDRYAVALGVLRKLIPVFECFRLSKVKFVVPARFNEHFNGVFDPEGRIFERLTFNGLIEDDLRAPRKEGLLIEPNITDFQAIQNVVATPEKVVLPLRASGLCFGEILLTELSVKRTFTDGERTFLENAMDILANAFLAKKNSYNTLRFASSSYTKADQNKNLISRPVGYFEAVEGAMMFMDVKGYTELTNRIDLDNLESGSLIEILNKIFRRTVPAVQSRLGVINNFVGDCQVSFFDKERCKDFVTDSIKAAIAIQREIGSLSQEDKRIVENFGSGLLQVRCGVASGKILMAWLGHESPGGVIETLIGDRANMAARTESACGPLGAHILFAYRDNELELLKKKSVLFRDLGSVSVKGNPKGLFMAEILLKGFDKTQDFRAESAELFSRMVSAFQQGNKSVAETLLGELENASKAHQISDPQLELFRSALESDEYSCGRRVLLLERRGGLDRRRNNSRISYFELRARKKARKTARGCQERAVPNRAS